MSKEFWVVDSQVMEVAYIERIVRPKCIGVYDTVRKYFFLYDGQVSVFALGMIAV